MEGQARTSTHALILPYPSQGHINPMLQFAKRLSAHGVRCTLAATRFTLSSTKPDPGPVHTALISDGCDLGGFTEAGSIPVYQDRLASIGSKTLKEFLLSESSMARPVNVLIYDSFCPWAGGVARRLRIPSVAFFTQPNFVNSLYEYVWRNQVPLPVQPDSIKFPVATELGPQDLPSYLVGSGPKHGYASMLLEQFKELDQADSVLINSFSELEPEETKYMTKTWDAKTIGPCIPTSHLNTQLVPDFHYGFHLFNPETSCMAWLDSNAANSVVYISFGSMSSLSAVQMKNIACGIYNAGKPFLWVVRSTEASKVPKGFAEMAKEIGKIVPWAQQLEILGHEAVGCFVTHCGWNSTMEAISLGVPMVAMPQLTDQPTNAKYVEAVWQVGLRVKADEEGLVGPGEIERCVKEVMEGERCHEFRSNARELRKRAKEAIGETGSSTRNVVEFVAKYAKAKY
ncbi:crocetin glucosyltransferase 2-like protein [Carex littledalei]|uniref:Glycosyltransferase n=1 Tax=Carex littledalei TaxID=544730 RepID=A0A833QWI1_9POAL|nr:crocetin glucosyltransferase 2-like protein [Carex littledalei]